MQILCKYKWASQDNLSPDEVAFLRKHFADKMWDKDSADPGNRTYERMKDPKELENIPPMPKDDVLKKGDLHALFPIPLQSDPAKKSQ